MKLKGVMNTEKDMLEHYLKGPKKSLKKYLLFKDLWATEDYYEKNLPLRHLKTCIKLQQRIIYMGKIFKKGKYMETAGWIAIFAIAIILAFLIIGSVISKLL